MEQFTSVGTLLRKIRENKNISIEEIAQKTKININVLRSLEKDELEKLPSKTYVKGFVRSYARTIGLDSEEAKTALESTYNAQLGEAELKAELQNESEAEGHHDEAEAKSNENAEEIKDKMNFIIRELFNKKVLIGAAVVIFCIVIFKGISAFVGQFKAEQSTSLTTTIKSDNMMLKDKSANILQMDATKKLAQEVIADKSETKPTLVVKPKIVIKPAPVTKVVKKEVKKVVF